jgi:hypothetical protein
MNEVLPSVATEPTAEARPPLGLLARAIAVFVRPADAWRGLEARAQWWFPMLIIVLLTVAGSLALHKRALIPMMMESWDKQVAAGAMTPERVDQMERFFESPAGMAASVGPTVLILPIITLGIALVIWFGVGFVLGTRMRYRHALEVAAWAGLVGLPRQLVAYLFAWSKESFRGIHDGFGILLPDMETPSRLMIGLGGFLDAIGPLALWYVIVGILGAAALSGAPRKSVAWVLGGLYLAIAAFSSALAAMFTPIS